MSEILTLNAGSSSIKFGLYGEGAEPALRASGQVEAIGVNPRIVARDAEGSVIADERFPVGGGHGEALRRIMALLTDAYAGAKIRVVGHRVVHGGTAFSAPTKLNAAAVEALAQFVPFAPLHQPHNLAAIRAAMETFPDAVQVACFDTAFHRGQPWVADTYALPRRFYEQGVRRYGFHGLSYAYIAGALRTVAPEVANGRVVIAHLGNGASMAAVKAGRPMGSTLGFTAVDGLPMGTRSGQIDPGVILWLIEEQGMSTAAVSDLLYKESGLKGLSGISPDMRALLASDAPEAAEAVAYFVHRVRREVGAMAAVLEGLDALVFTGGIGENAAPVRAAICDGFDWMGLSVDAARNEAGETVISPDHAAVKVLVIPTNEEIVIARACVGFR
jgi:acetate kinase